MPPAFMIRVRFLGTAAARPTVARNVTAIAVQREGTSMLWDCGEGTQRQIMRYGTGLSFDHVFVTHAHADHFLGLPGLLRTLGLQGRERPLDIYGPPRATGVLQKAVHLGSRGLPFPVEVSPMQDGSRVVFDGWAVESFSVDHGIPAVGYALVEDARPGRFDVAKARALGVPEGPLFGRLQRGESVEVDGRTVHSNDLLGAPRPGRRVVFAGDCRPCVGTVAAASGCDLLIHEATFTREEADRARETRHSTAFEAADVARQAGARRLVLTHVSARYSELPKVLAEEASDAFPGAEIAYDGMQIEVPLREQ